MANEHQMPEYQPVPYGSELAFLPIPDDFPVHWPSPEDQRLLWELDTHYVKPRKALDDVLIKILVDHFLVACNDVYAYPFKIKSWVVNNSLYGSYAYDLGPVPEEGIRKYMAILEPVMLNLMDIWETEWLPEIKRHLAYWEAFDLSNASIPALLEHWDETIRRQHICWNIRLRLFMPIMLGRDIFHQTYQSIFDGAGSTDGCAMLLAYGRNTKYDRDLWALSREVMASPKLYPLVANNPPDAILDLLDDSAQCHAFKQKLADLSLIYGKRGERGTLVSKTINPAPLLETLQHYFRQPEDYLENQILTWETDRNERLQSVREKLQGFPQDVRDKFERHLKMTENANQLRELNNEWIDVPIMNHFRMIVQEFACRLIEGGVLEKTEEVYHLTADDLWKAVAMLPEVLDVRQRIQERQAEEERFAHVTPPAFIGAYPLDAEYTLDPLTLSYINTEAPEPVEVPGGLGGVPAAPGKVRGRAKLLKDLYDSHKLEPGDIMVVGSLAPAWTPLFHKAGAVLADIGGVLSHAAVLAREFGIPCVVGFRIGTHLIRDGQWLEVDGDKGTVLFLDESAEPA
jgi:pyruvate,water dikinase